MIRQADFTPAWWLPGPHLQTLFPQFFRRAGLPALKRRRLELEDGDFIDLDFTADRRGPLVVLLHGLEGRLHSHYVRGLMTSLPARGLQTVLFNFRGCSGQPNRLVRSYHSGETGDLTQVLSFLTQLFPDRPIYAVGISLGGNVLLKWLAEQSTHAQIARAVAVSVPFELDTAARRLESGLSRLYQAYLLGKLRRSLKLKSRQVQLPFEISELRRLNTFRLFDDQVTAPIHGFEGVDDYYRRSSCRPWLRAIQLPTLILHAADDPFMTSEAIPRASELGKGVVLEIASGGGHVGFIDGHLPWRPRYWLDERIGEFFTVKPQNIL